MSLAGRTGWLDVAARDWWDDALGWSGATRGLMPPLVAAGVPVGAITSEAVSPHLRGAVLTLAGHDHQASALGARATGPGHELDSSGTAEALVRTVAIPARADVARLAATGITTDPSVEPGHWSLLGGTEGGLAQLRTLERLGVKPADVAESGCRRRAHPSPVPARSGGTVVAAAADEALALHRAMDDVVGPAVPAWWSPGGWRHSAEVMRAKVARFGPLDVSDVEEAGALGAATLAARACGASARTTTWVTRERTLVRRRTPRRGAPAARPLIGASKVPTGRAISASAPRASARISRSSRRAASCGGYTAGPCRASPAAPNHTSPTAVNGPGGEVRHRPGSPRIRAPTVLRCSSMRASTTLRLAEMLPTDAELVVYTNSCPSAPHCTNGGSTVVTLGGRIRPATMASVGCAHRRSAGRINVDVAFLGTNALSFDRGLTTPDARGGRRQAPDAGRGPAAGVPGGLEQVRARESWPGTPLSPTSTC